MPSSRSEPRARRVVHRQHAVLVATVEQHRHARLPERSTSRQGELFPGAGPGPQAAASEEGGSRCPRASRARRTAWLDGHHPAAGARALNLSAGDFLDAAAEGGPIVLTPLQLSAKAPALRLTASEQKGLLRARTKIEHIRKNLLRTSV